MQNKAGRIKGEDKGIDCKMILWKHHIAEHFERGYTPKGRLDGVGTGGHLHEDLAALIQFCLKDGREWSIAKIECSPIDVEPDQDLSNGWYKARCDILSERGFIPLEEVQRRYLN